MLRLLSAILSTALFFLTAGQAAAIPAGDTPVERIDPPHWWIGLGDGNLQLLVYGASIAEWTPSLEHPGVTLLRSQQTENPNYLFLDLVIAADAEPGTLMLRFSKGKKHYSQPFELKARSGWQPAGLGPEDLIYLIMPDRFANGRTDNDAVPGTNDERVDRENDYLRHGGDLAGITERLDYLAELGVTALWLNPVVANDQPEASYHGYAATDLYAIDPRLGTHQEYLDFTAACRERGIKVVMDIIHNHWGDRHRLYTDRVSDSWFHLYPSFTKTTYKDFTLMDPHAAEADRLLMAEGWFDTHMPDLDQTDPLLARYLLQNNLWWIEEAGTDAFRMDTWAYSDQGFLEDWSRALHETYPGMGLFAETWVHGGSVQAFYGGNTILDKSFDPYMPGLTDFQLYYAINEALTTPMGWTEGVSRLYLTLAKDFLYRDPYNNVVFLDNHDLSRFFGVVDRDTERFKAGIIWLLTTRGIPMLYYGTEILMGEKADAHGGSVRRDFPGGWEGDDRDAFSVAGRTAEEQQAFTWVKTLSNYRKKHPVLHRGKLTQFVPENGVYVYFRHNDQESVMVVMNCNDKAVELGLDRFRERTADFRQGKDLLNGSVIRLEGTLALDRYESRVFELTR